MSPSSPWNSIQAFVSSPFVGFAFGAVVLVVSYRLNATGANLLLVLAWIIFTFSVFRLPVLSETEPVARILWTLLAAAIIGLALYYCLGSETKSATTGTEPVFSVEPSGEYTIQFGTNRETGRINPNSQVGWGFGSPDGGPLVTGHIDDKRLYFDTRVYGGANNSPVTVINNKVMGLPEGWDANFDNQALEIVDKNKKPVFQVQYKSNYHISFTGHFWTKKGLVVSVDELAMRVVDQPANISLARIFRYPSTKFPQKRARSRLF